MAGVAGMDVPVIGAGATAVAAGTGVVGSLDPGAGAGGGGVPGAGPATTINIMDPAVQTEIKRQVDASAGIFQASKTQYDEAYEALKAYLPLLKDPAFQSYAEIHNSGRVPVVSDPDTAPKQPGARPDPRARFNELIRRGVSEGGMDEQQARYHAESILSMGREIAAVAEREVEGARKEFTKALDEQKGALTKYQERRLIQDLEYDDPVVSVQSEEDGGDIRVSHLREYRPAVEKLLESNPKLHPLDGYRLSAFDKIIGPHMKTRRDEEARAKAAEGLGGRGPGQINTEDLTYPTLDERGIHGMKLKDFRDAMYAGANLEVPG